MRRSLISQAVEEAEEPNICLLYTAEITENAAILIAIGPAGEIYMDGRRIDVRQVKANVIRLMAENPQGAVVMQADEKATAEKIIAVMDEVREAGVIDISIASEPNF